AAGRADAVRRDRGRAVVRVVLAPGLPAHGAAQAAHAAATAGVPLEGGRGNVRAPGGTAGARTARDPAPGGGRARGGRPAPAPGGARAPARAAPRRGAPAGRGAAAHARGGASARRGAAAPGGAATGRGARAPRGPAARGGARAPAGAPAVGPGGGGDHPGVGDPTRAPAPAEARASDAG